MKAYIAVPATLALVLRAYSKKSLTTGGLVAAAMTAIAHAVHPWNMPFVLLVVFFLAGTRATHVKEYVKAQLTMPATGPTASGGEGPRTSVQVFANSFVGSVLTLLHAYQLSQRKKAMLAIYTGAPTPGIDVQNIGSLCYSWGGDLLVIGIIANYAAVAADTFSSELGILSKSTPRLITSLTLRKVPRGTNGGVTLVGLGAGLLGSIIIVTASLVFLPLCNGETTVNARLFGKAASAASAGWSAADRRTLMVFLTLWGLLGSVLDSVLGGLFQRSVKDVRSGKIVEGNGGERVIVTETPGEHMHGTSTEAELKEKEKEDKEAKEAKADAAPVKQRRPSFGDGKPSRVVENGWDLFDNNDVNFLMALTMSFSAMGAAGWYWGIPMSSIFKP